MPHEFFLPIGLSQRTGYGGKSPQFDWGDNVFEVQTADIPKLELDVIIFQGQQQYEADQWEILAPKQRRLPKIYVEHDPPRIHPTDTVHPVQDGITEIVHVTHFNQLMWDNGNQPNRVIEHGVKLIRPARYQGQLDRGLVVINNLADRGRRLGKDVVETVKMSVPLDVVGMGSEELGGRGEVPPKELPGVMAGYRFVFSPIRYTSLGLALIEAMMVGLPVVGLATTELATVIRNGKTGYIDTDITKLIAAMQMFIENKEWAQKMAPAVRKAAAKRFGIKRFINDWMRLIEEVTTKEVKKASVITTGKQRPATGDLWI